MENIIKMTMGAPQPEVLVEVDSHLFGKFTQQIPIWDYSSTSRKVIQHFLNLKKRN